MGSLVKAGQSQCCASITGIGELVIGDVDQENAEAVGQERVVEQGEQQLFRQCIRTPLFQRSGSQPSVSMEVYHLQAAAATSATTPRAVVAATVFSAVR